ncbi:MAG: potassium/proton antiporter [Fibrobacter sp.]|jgi:cell volume regulation protein A|nr:potassium/proton antiporter [Fibrobacter sp.]
MMFLNFTAETILLIASVLLFASVLVTKMGARFGVPALLLFLGVGMAGGVDGFGIEFNNAAVAQFIGMMALSVILFSGGMDTRFEEIKPVLAPGIILATLGVLLTSLITGLFIYFIAGQFQQFIKLSLTESFLLASVMSSTDSASVFSILRSKGLNLKHRLRPLLELESGSNDPMAYMLTIFFISMIQMNEVSLFSSVVEFILQLGIGLVAGYFLGLLTTVVINRINMDQNSLYPILLFACVFFIFSITDKIHGNGYLAVYIAGLVVGNKRILHKKSISTFFDGFSRLWQILIFLTLGLLVVPSDLLKPSVAGMGLLVGIFMILVARPLTVFLCYLPFRNVSLKARLYISWIGLRGAVPIIFATYPFLAGIENASLIFDVVFFITILSLIVQGTTVSSSARLLGLSEEMTEDNNMFGIELPDEIKSSMSEIAVIPSLLEKGNRLMNIALPDNTLVVMIKRQDKYFVPKGNTILFEGDKLVLLSDNEEALQETYRTLGITHYTIRRN